MNENQFLIPANSKKGQLIFGLFFPIDFAIFATGIGLTFALLLIMSSLDVKIWASILSVVPAGVALILVVPIPNYHNVRIAIGEIISFYSNNRNYKWRGWCSMYEYRNK